jgi:hypothetical protein
MNPFEGEIKKIKEKEIYYYLLPEGLHLFKATIRDDTSAIKLNPKGFYFFGVKNMNPSYIEGYEELYGVIHEFKTTCEYRLLALDNEDTRKFLYEHADNDRIKKILKNNYGYTSGKRDSESNADRELSEYICKLGYDGYAIHDMDTDFGGKFHDEFMICKIDGIEYVKMVSDKDKIPSILANNEAKNARIQGNQPKKKPRKSAESPKSPVRAIRFPGFSDSYESPKSPKSPKTHTKRRLFGGKKNSTRKRKTSRKH